MGKYWIPDDHNYPPPPYPPQYGPPIPYPPPVPQTSSMAVTALIVGAVGMIVTLISCGFLAIFGIVPVIFGHLALRETRHGRMGGQGLAIAGLAMGYLQLVLGLLFFLNWLFVVIG